VDLYEYQGKQLFAGHGIPVPSGQVAETPEEARAAAEAIGGRIVVKAQVQVGGRGKAGGIKVADTPDEAEARAAERPDELARLHIDPLTGFQQHHGRWLVYHSGIDVEAQKGVLDILTKLYAAFIDLDALLLEINPLILTTDGRVIALDAKVTIDNNALYRHPDLAAFQESVTSDPQERLAHEKGVTYVKLDGDVGILGNGAGLVMSTLDVVALAGGRPANFLDAGGGSRADEVVAALVVLLSDPKVKSLLVNIFGGITRCDEVAEGLLTALDRLGTTLPIVVRLDGTNEVEGRAIIAERAPANVVVETTMLSAARRAVELAKEAA